MRNRLIFLGAMIATLMALCTTKPVSTMTIWDGLNYGTKGN